MSNDTAELRTSPVKVEWEPVGLADIFMRSNSVGDPSAYPIASAKQGRAYTEVPGALKTEPAGLEFVERTDD